MLRRHRSPVSRVFFPWERKRGPLGVLGRARSRLVLVAFVVLAVLTLLRRHEEARASDRATRASITTATLAVAAFRADHGGDCPKDLEELVRGGYARDLPIDAWGRPLRVTCPGRRDPRGFDVSSDGPDGIPGGLDRVE